MSDFKSMELSLLDTLAAKAGCDYVSDLKFLPNHTRARLARIVEKIPLETISLDQWNDVSIYLTGNFPCNDAATARKRIIDALSQGQHFLPFF